MLLPTLPVRRPKTYEKAAAELREAAAKGIVMPHGGGTKLEWGAPGAPETVLSTEKLDRIVEHNSGDLTAIVQAGVRLVDLRDELAKAGQMLAIDPPILDGATIGGTLATADSGPLRHRYGAPRDLVLGMTVALSDGTLARAGGKVIKNVAGYDLAKLFTGSFGTLGLILEVAVRLHPLPARTATAIGASAAPELVAGAAMQLTHSALEAQCIDVRWEDGRGDVLARFARAEALAQAREAAAPMEAGGAFEVEVEEDDAALWDEQRARQRAADGIVVRVSGVQTQLEDQMRAAAHLGGELAARAAHGLAWVRLPDAEAVEALRRELAPSPCVLLDAPHAVRDGVDPWGPADGGAVELMRRVKARFDPAGALNTHKFVGGI
jgi:glycolate oxidase FAD binding subunit